MFENLNLQEKSVLVIGCGGLGGYVISNLARMNIGKLVVMDGDSFDESNMNRQMLASFSNIGKNKAKCFEEWIKDISKTNIIAYSEHFSEKNSKIINDVDIVFDCVDNINTRLLLAKECSKCNKILIHGAIEGEEGQAMVIFPNDGKMEKLYKGGIDTKHETVSYAVSTVANIQTSLLVRVLNGEAEDLKDKLVLIDLESLCVKKIVL